MNTDIYRINKSESIKTIRPGNFFREAFCINSTVAIRGFYGPLSAAERPPRQRALRTIRSNLGTLNTTTGITTN